MMLIKTRIYPSRIHGLGLFAVETVPAGSVIWRYRNPPDYRIPVADWHKYSPYENWYTHRRHGYIFIGTDYIEFPGDGAMFINHSEDPTLKPKGIEEMITIKPINANEEITCDYRDIETELEVEILTLYRRQKV